MAQNSGTVKENLVCKSKILGYDVKYSIYLPNDYDKSSRSYPVLYLLHGYSDKETAWIQYAEVNNIADKLVANREISPMIIVMPDAKLTFYANDYQNKNRYEDFFFQEFIPSIESLFRIRAQKQYRAISGLSMGGFGSLMYAMHHPDMFSACVAFSSAVCTPDEIKDKDTQLLERLSAVLGPIDSNKFEFPTYWCSNIPYFLAQTVDAEQLKTVKWYIDCGDGDFLTRGNCALHEIFFNRQIPHEFRVRDGYHNWDYWQSGIGDGLKFMSRQFRQY